MPDTETSSSTPAKKGAGFKPGDHVRHVSGELYVVLGAGPEELDAGNGPEPTYVLLPESVVTHPQPGSLLELVE
jgi:hypothetical protein